MDFDQEEFNRLFRQQLSIWKRLRSRLQAIRSAMEIVFQMHALTWIESKSPILIVLGVLQEHQQSFGVEGSQVLRFLTNELHNPPMSRSEFQRLYRDADLLELDKYLKQEIAILEKEAGVDEAQLLELSFEEVKPIPPAKPQKNRRS